jgi:CheY-like chemotaxis protein
VPKLSVPLKNLALYQLINSTPRKAACSLFLDWTPPSHHHRGFGRFCRAKDRRTTPRPERRATPACTPAHGYEDNFRRILVRVLQRAGYTVTDISNANDAIALLKRNTPFELLITDITMPHSQPNGIAVGSMAKQKRRSIKIIYISGDPHQVPSFIDVKETPLLEKPIKLEALLAAVENVLGTGQPPS